MFDYYSINRSPFLPRAAETKKFPLVKPDLRVSTHSECSVSFRPRNPLEEQVMALLRKSNTAEESTRLSKKEEDMLAQMTVGNVAKVTKSSSNKSCSFLLGSRG